MDPCDNQGWTPLHEAARNGHLDVVELLLARGADFSIRDDRDRSPLVLASENGNPKVANFLFEHMAASMSILEDGAANTTLSTISLQNAPPSIAPPPREREEDVTSSDSGQCSVYSASQNGQFDIVRSLLDRGHDVNDRNSRRETALDVASRFGQLEVARLLIERGADVDARDRDGWTPLITALEYGQLEVARLLLDRGADVNAKKRDHNTPLHRASFKGSFEMVRLLLDHGANVDVRNHDGQTPREIAIQLGHRRILELFGKRGQSVSMVRIIYSFESYRIPDTSPCSPPFLCQPHHLAPKNDDISTVSAHRLPGCSNPALRAGVAPGNLSANTRTSLGAPSTCTCANTIHS